MLFRKAISQVLLVALLLWSVSALCVPIEVAHGPACDKLAYRTMVMTHPHVAGMASHRCCPPEKMIVVVCYRMHGDGGCDSMRGCGRAPADQAISGTSKYHDAGQARACAMAHATHLLIPSTEHSSANWERAGLRYAPTVLDSKADLRI